MVARFIPFLLVPALSAGPLLANDGTTRTVDWSAPAVANNDPLPPVDWGEPPSEVIERPYMCRGPVEVEDNVEVYTCARTFLGREAMVGLYFVDGSYACFVATMRVPSIDDVAVQRAFDGIVSDLEAEVGPVSDRNGPPDEKPVVTWLNDKETIKATVESVGSSTLIGIVALADGQEPRMARLVRW
jgi:hypothetical protein